MSPGAELPAESKESSAVSSISVLIPAFNGSREITAALESVVTQDFPNFDILVINDGSTDATRATVEEFFRCHPGRGRLVSHEENWGLSRTLNHGLRETSGGAILVLHQDITLVSPDWLSRAAATLGKVGGAAVVTGNYGIPAAGEVRFAERVFGVMRRQFPIVPRSGLEEITFTEFKCDLVRRSALEAVSGFPERFRIAGEDLWVSCALRARDLRLFKDYSLQSTQRFTGNATSVTGNLRKEYGFGKAIAGTLIHFRGALGRGLQGSAYARSRSWNRASQPFVVIAVIVLVALGALSRYPGFWLLLGALLTARYAYYVLRLYGGVRRMIGRTAPALAESLLGAPLGVVTDFAYTLGLGVGVVRWASGRRI